MVVFLRPTETVPKSPFVVPWLDGESLRCTFTSIRLWKQPPEHVLEAPFYDLWPLASLMAGATLETIVQVAERIAIALISRQERGELASLLVLLAGIRFRSPSLVEALRRANMIEDLLKESSFGEVMYELFREEIEGKALAEGRAEGRAAGMAEGRAEALRTLTSAAIEGRFGALPDDLVNAVATADEQTCLAIAAHITPDTWEELRARLGVN